MSLPQSVRTLSISTLLPIDDLRTGYEVAAGVLATYAYSPAIGGGISWIYGKLAGGEMARPGDAQGRDSRVLHLWISATR